MQDYRCKQQQEKHMVTTNHYFPLADQVAAKAPEADKAATDDRWFSLNGLQVNLLLLLRDFNEALQLQRPIACSASIEIPLVCQCHKVACK